MSALSNESFSHYMCVEATLPFSVIAQRLKIRRDLEMNTPAEIAQNYVGIGRKKTELPIVKMIVLGMLAGMFIGFGAIGFQIATATISSLRDWHLFCLPEVSCLQETVFW